MEKAMHREGREFRQGERASVKTIAGATPELMLDDPAIQGDRPVACECGCPDVGSHNARVTDLSFGRLGGFDVSWLEVGHLIRFEDGEVAAVVARTQDGKWIPVLHKDGSEDLASADEIAEVLA